MIDLNKIVFREQYIDEKPKENCWRGIMVYLNDIQLYQIDYDEDWKGNSQFFINGRFLPTDVLISHQDRKMLTPSITYNTKEKVIEAVKKCIIEYFNLFK